MKPVRTTPQFRPARWSTRRAIGATSWIPTESAATAHKSALLNVADLATEIDFIESLPGGRVLDVGCGLGWLLSALGDRWAKQGIELSSFAAERASEHADIFNGPLLDCPFPNGSFDLIVMHHVIEHMAEPVPNIGRVWELLRPGGRLLLGTPDFDSGCARRFGANYRLLHDTTHVSLFSHDSMHRFLRDHGFKIGMVDYPFFETRHFARENLQRLFDVDRISPAFYGNFMTFYCTRSDHSDSTGESE